MTNFDFLKDIDPDLFTIAGIAEKLYRDEYFEQCMGQTRRFAENAVKKVLGSHAPYDATFDELINTLKDRSGGAAIEKEFIDDLYFLKKAGNLSVHGATVKKDAITAMECLRRMFEVAINYAVHLDKTNAHLLKKNYDEELLLLGRPKQEQTLKEKYLAAKQILEKQDKKKEKTQKPLSPKKLKKTVKKPLPKIKTEKIKPAEKETKQQKKIKGKKLSTKTLISKKSKQNKSSKQKEPGLPLFLNPVIITISFFFGAIVIALIGVLMRNFH